MAPTAPCHSPPKQRETKVWDQQAQLLPALTGGAQDRPPLIPTPVLPQKDNFISRSRF